MKLLSKCPVCRKKRFYIRKWRYVGSNLPTGAVTSDSELCKGCHDKINLLVLGKWSVAKRLEYVIMKLTNYFKHD